MGSNISAEELYLDLLKRLLTRYLFESYNITSSRLKRALYHPIRTVLASRGLELVRKMPANWSVRNEGRDWPHDAETMIGMKRLDNLQKCVTQVVKESIPGDIIETGVWRGGAAIFMRAILKAYGDTTRKVWLADSFQGLPRPDGEKYPADAPDRLWTFKQLAVSEAEVRANFEKYGMLDEQVRFLPGWFRDTLPGIPCETFSVIRLDGDLYESTRVALDSLYPKLSIGGFAIIDDYGAVPGCKAAVDDYRFEHGIQEPIESIDWGGAFWRRLA